MENWNTTSLTPSFVLASNLGRIKTINRIDTIGRRVKGRILRIKTGKDGYQRVSFHDNGKQRYFLVSRLVAAAFIHNHAQLPCVNHKNGVLSDNTLENLEWSSSSDNMKHAYRTLGRRTVSQKGVDHNMAKLTENGVLQIRKIGKSLGLKKIAEMFSVSKCTIWEIQRRATWNHI